MNKQMLKTNNKKEMVKRCALLALVFTAFLAFAAAIGILPVAAAPAIDTSALDDTVSLVVEIVGLAAKYIGVIIIIWGVFQIVLAFRREDSEGISKQITTVVVGAVLTVFGVFAKSMYEKLIK